MQAVRNIVYMLSVLNRGIHYDLLLCQWERMPCNIVSDLSMHSLSIAPYFSGARHA